MKNLALYETKYWIEKFITESLIKVDEMLQARTGNAHILSLKKHNIKTIENFKNETIAYIEKLENEIENLKNPKNIKAGASLQDIPRWEITTQNQKEAMRMDSINDLKLRKPELF